MRRAVGPPPGKGDCVRGNGRGLSWSRRRGGRTWTSLGGRRGTVNQARRGPEGSWAEKRRAGIPGGGGIPAALPGEWHREPGCAASRLRCRLACSLDPGAGLLGAARPRSEPMRWDPLACFMPCLMDLLTHCCRMSKRRRAGCGPSPPLQDGMARLGCCKTRRSGRPGPAIPRDRPHRRSGPDRTSRGS